MNRREVLRSIMAAAAGYGVSRLSGLGHPSVVKAGEQGDEIAMPVRPLGTTGLDVKLFSLGGESTVQRRDRSDEAVEIINRALDLGVNYIDTSSRYGRGGSEENIGRVLEERRGEVFLATKAPQYDYDGAMKGCEESLKRLRTDYIDLYQHHGVQDDEQLDEVLAQDGALKAFRKLKDEGVVRHIGISSHSPKVLIRALKHYDYECTFITLNPVRSSAWPWAMNDTQYLEEFFALAREKNAGVIGMKVTGRGEIFKRGITMKQALGYVLSLPVSTAVVGITELKQLEENARLASEFEPLEAEQMEGIEKLVSGSVLS